ncbi:MAG: response regulator [Patescibacteria group bacterium]|nr:response regulator [Patescibacteria group bacterium]
MPKTKKTILIVDDEAPMLEALSSKFKNKGFKTIEAADGEEGLAAALSNRPDLILLDIIMPKIDGMTVMKKIREDKKWGQDVPIIMLTNLDDPESVSEAASYKVFDFLVKTDWRLEDIAKLVEDKLDIMN